VVLPITIWLALAWLTTRFQRMATLIDKLGRIAEKDDLRRLAESDQR
jgi:hypothetical protein